MQERTLYIDYLKALAIVLVSLGHTIGNLSNGSNARIVLMICYSIELPLFYMATGALNKLRTSDYLSRTYVIKRFKSIMYPYLTFSIFYILFHFLITAVQFVRHGSFFWKMVKWDLIDIISLWGIGPLWFLPTLFFSELFFNIIRKFRGGGYALIAYSAIIAITLLGSTELEPYYESFLNHTANWGLYAFAAFTRVFAATLFIGIGYYVFSIVEMCGKRMDKISSIILGIGGTLIGFLISTLNKEIFDLHFGYIRNPIVTFCTAAICCFSIMLVLRNTTLQLLS